MAVADKIAGELSDLHAEETSPGMAAVALDLAKAIDSTNVPGAKAAAAHQLRSIMADLRGLAPIEAKGDGVDGIVGAHAERKSRLRSVPASGE